MGSEQEVRRVDLDRLRYLLLGLIGDVSRTHRPTGALTGELERIHDHLDRASSLILTAVPHLRSAANGIERAVVLAADAATAADGARETTLASLTLAGYSRESLSPLDGFLQMFGESDRFRVAEDRQHAWLGMEQGDPSSFTTRFNSGPGSAVALAARRSLDPLRIP